MSYEFFFRQDARSAKDAMKGIQDLKQHELCFSNARCVFTACFEFLGAPGVLSDQDHEG
jgi:hypothetical protein